MLAGLGRTARMLFAAIALISLVVPSMVGAAPTPPPPAQGPPVVSVSVSGNTHVPTDRILAVVKTKVGDPFDPQTVQQDLASIFALGYFADQVPPLIKQRPDGIAITFRVIENPVITRITFDGNAHVSSDTLLALMDTATGQVFNTNTFHQDVLKINSYYDKIGYGGQLPTHVADINIDPQTGVLTLKIQEGLTVRQVIITGDPVISPDLIKAAISIKPGTPYSEELRDKDVDAIKKLYEKYDLQLGDFEGGIDPSTVDLKTLTADVRYSIYAARVGAVEITGNTKTHDDVIRRELRLRPGMVITQSALKHDYERLNNLGFFDKVELNPKPGPDPKRPAYITLDWEVKEQRTGTAQIGAGYSGGLTGTGLTGTLSYSENNINGTGDGASISFQRGSRTTNISISGTIPYLGKTPKSQRYSLGATVYTNSQNNYYPVYAVPTSSPNPNGPAHFPGSYGNNAQPVTLFPLYTNPVQVPGIVSNYASSSTGLGVQLGRRFNDYFRASFGVSISQVASSANLPSGYFFSDNQTVLASTGNSTNTLNGGTSSSSQALGVTAPSLANTNSTAPYALRTFSIGLTEDTRDDVFNPRHGINAAFQDQISPGKIIGSDFNFQIITIDVAKYWPILKNATWAMHFKDGISTGAIPTSSLFTLSDQQLRGYSQVFYGTNLLLGQGELRVPLTADKKLGIAFFADEGATMIRGAAPIFDSNNNLIATPGQWGWHGDVGVGVRFDVPQLGLRTIRLDFAKGSQGTHTSFGVGQSF